MNKGVLIYAHNSKEIDYLDLAIVSGHLAKKNLQVPISLVTDGNTFEWAKNSGKLPEVESIFEKIIFSDDYTQDKKRRLHDGNDYSDVLFLNGDRYNAWNLTPYDRTLLIDSDFLIFSKSLNNFWNVDSSFLISESALDFHNESRFEYNDRYISEVGIRMRWATTIMFTKNQESKMVFDLVKLVKDNYFYFAELYRFNNRTYRNDIAFSIALHILNGNKEIDRDYFLPPISSCIDKDVLIDVDKDKLFFLISSKIGDSYSFCSKKDQDVHIMNKQSLVRNKFKLLES
jgi:hypothetical protein